MASNSMANLSEKIQQQLKADQEAVSSQTSELLKLHEQSLKKLSQDALNTTRSVFSKQQSQIQQLSESTFSKLKWLMLWPILGSLSLSLLLIVSAAGWSWWTVNQASSQAERILSDQRIKLQQMNSEFCSSPAGKKYCRPAD